MKLQGIRELLDLIEEDQHVQKLTADDKHIWVKDQHYKDSTFKEKHDCIRCKCRRLKSQYGRFTSYIYTRDGIVLPERPNCINWAKENQKSID